MRGEVTGPAGNAEEAAASCSRALVMDKHCVKALFRRSEVALQAARVVAVAAGLKALRTMGRNTEALADLEHARCLEPQNNTLLYALEDVEELLDEERFIEKSASGPPGVPSGDKIARDAAPAVGRVADDVMHAHQEFVDGCMERLAAEFKQTVCPATVATSERIFSEHMLCHVARVSPACPRAVLTFVAARRRVPVWCAPGSQRRHALSQAGPRGAEGWAADHREVREASTRVMRCPVIDHRGFRDGYSRFATPGPFSSHANITDSAPFLPPPFQSAPATRYCKAHPGYQGCALEVRDFPYAFERSAVLYQLPDVCQQQLGDLHRLQLVRWVFGGSWSRWSVESLKGGRAALAPYWSVESLKGGRAALAPYWSVESLKGGRAALASCHIVRIGKIEIEGAFVSREMLASAFEYVKSQHATAFANCACVIARKSSMLYPLVWWAGSWPFDIDQDGAFVELVLPGAAMMARTWFMPLAGGGGHLEKGVELDIDCSIMYDLPSMFPH
ncbi:hypothetical protein CYMTET_4878 [Cymbomonas tetramitiformis]|uniref:Uncharacterized protein n=1 Tax=Cymbomonas tetramitiformis TaxID=36881 RepID=A0AAE0H0I1_9CHLO|nr:hypothetical protein CYMTET_4878 [Cymbomonas tetramitiformis]